MLSLTRKLGERIFAVLQKPFPAGTEIEIKVLDIQLNRVRLGISAPMDIAIHREEVWVEIEKQEIQNKKDKENEDCTRSLAESIGVPPARPGA